MELIVFLIIIVVANVLSNKGKKETASRSQAKPGSTPKKRQGNFAEWVANMDAQIKEMERTGRVIRTDSLPEAPDNLFGEVYSQPVQQAPALEMQEHADFIVEKPAPKVVKKKQRQKHKMSIMEDSTEGLGTEGQGDYHTLYEEHREETKPGMDILPSFQKQDLVKAFVLSEILKPKYTEEN